MTQNIARSKKVAIRLIIAYTQRPDMSKSQRVLETAKVKVIREATEKSLLARTRNEVIR